MSKSIVITVPHSLGKEEARRRIASEIDQLKTTYVDKFAFSEVNWIGDAAEIRIVALAQEVKAHVNVAADSLRVEVLLPWLLASLASKVQNQVTTTASDTLAIEHSSKKA